MIGCVSLIGWVRHVGPIKYIRSSLDSFSQLQIHFQVKQQEQTDV